MKNLFFLSSVFFSLGCFAQYVDTCDQNKMKIRRNGSQLCYDDFNVIYTDDRRLNKVIDKKSFTTFSYDSLIRLTAFLFSEDIDSLITVYCFKEGRNSSFNPYGTVKYRITELELFDLKKRFENNFLDKVVGYDSNLIYHPRLYRYFLEFDDFVAAKIYYSEGISVDLNFREETSNVIDGVYLRFESDYTIEYQATSNSMFISPFAIKNTAVTNREYRAFINWVRDSIARELLFEKCEDVELKKEMLIYENECTEKAGIWKPECLGEEGMFLSKKEREIDYNDLMLREQFNLNWDFEFRYDERWLIPIVNELYLPTSQRYYTQRQFDVSQFRYKYYDSNGRVIETSIYPDTLGFVEMNKENWKLDFFTNMYMWYNGADNMPVVNVSYEQVQAYLHWKQIMLNKEMSIKGYTIQIELPSMEEVELALNQITGTPLRNNFSPLDRIIERSDAEEILSTGDNGLYSYISKVFSNNHPIQCFGWNVSEFSRTIPGDLMELITGKQWNDDSRIIYGSNWVLRTKKYQENHCTDAIETTDVIEGTSISKPYLGFRYVLRLVPK